ncbi:MAG: hypothetical protein LQ344_004928 [Seirophora lacunosa]|nr:MAG: hypothetical protein LQ344_004928 [Seirophora lacunosa]
MSTADPSSPPHPSLFRYTLSFLLVGIAWGLTTPFIRRAALDFHPAPHSSLTALLAKEPSRRSSSSTSPTSTSRWRENLSWGWWWVRVRVLGAFWTVLDLLRSPRYAAPLVVNLTGSVWFFLLVGGSELSLTVPITNSLAFLFTVLGEWWAEGKVIGRDTWLGMACVVAGIALCVGSKSW